MSKASRPAFIQASADWAAVRKGHVNELKKVSAPVSFVITGLFASLSCGGLIWTDDLQHLSSTPAWQAGGQPIAQRASCFLHRTSEHHPTAAYPHFPVPKIAALPRVHPPKLPMYSQSRAAA